MRLVTPSSLHYPITVTKLRCKADDEVERNTPLFDYTYKSLVVEGSAEDKEGKPVLRDLRTTFESYTEGSLTKWYLQADQVVTRPG